MIKSKKLNKNNIVLLFNHYLINLINDEFCKCMYMYIIDHHMFHILHKIWILLCNRYG